MANELILEIGTEEIPALFLAESSSNFKKLTEESFEKNSLIFSGVETFYTPRRMVIKVSGLLPKQKEIIQESFGPPKKIAYDEKGNPTKAAIGFAKSQGVGVKDLNITKRDNGEFLSYKKKIKGISTDKVLKQVLPEIIKSIHFRKSMKWGDSSLTFTRPIRWILCIYNGKKLSFELEELKSGSISYGHRFNSPKPFTVKDWKGYLSELKKRKILLNQDERKDLISKQVNALAKKLGGFTELDEELLETVTNLVEYPVVIHGNFEKRFLNLPPEVLISVMKKHQKYFPVYAKNGKLLPYFIFVCGTQVADTKVVASGNERVLRARFTDAEFFWNEDLKSPLEENLKKLESMVFLSQVGNYLEKTLRLEKLSTELIKNCGISNKKIASNLKRSARLSKADLVSQMVFEFAELQGIMGKYYANASGENKEIAAAIEEQYMPTGREGRLPGSETGALLSITDKIDNISSCFSVGLKPTGSADPYALRRQAIGIIQIVLNNELNLDLEDIFSKSVKLVSGKKSGQVQSEIIAFFTDRFKNFLIDEGYTNTVIDSVTSTGFRNILESYYKIKAVEKFSNQKEFEELAVTFKRVVNIAKDEQASKLNTKLFKDSSEKNLNKTFSEINNKTEKYFKPGSITKDTDYIKALNLIKTLKKPVDDFFDSVMVMDKNEKIKNNRLALLGEIKNLFFNISDFSKI